MSARSLPFAERTRSQSVRLAQRGAWPSASARGFAGGLDDHVSGPTLRWLVRIRRTQGILDPAHAPPDRHVPRLRSRQPSAASFKPCPRHVCHFTRGHTSPLLFLSGHHLVRVVIRLDAGSSVAIGASRMCQIPYRVVSHDRSKMVAAVTAPGANRVKRRFTTTCVVTPRRRSICGDE